MMFSLQPGGSRFQRILPSGFNVQPLVDLLDDPEVADIAAKGLSHTLLVFDAFHDVEEKAKGGNAAAQKVMQSWADAEWFHSRPKVPEKITVTVFKVTGETNTDDLSPAPDAWSRPDIPLHANAMLKIERDGIHDAKAQLKELAEKGHDVGGGVRLCSKAVHYQSRPRVLVQRKKEDK